MILQSGNSEKQTKTFEIQRAIFCQHSNQVVISQFAICPRECQSILEDFRDQTTLFHINSWKIIMQH